METGPKLSTVGSRGNGLACCHRGNSRKSELISCLIIFIDCFSVIFWWLVFVYFYGHVKTMVSTAYVGWLRLTAYWATTATRRDHKLRSRFFIHFVYSKYRRKPNIRVTTLDLQTARVARARFLWRRRRGGAFCRLHRAHIRSQYGRNKSVITLRDIGWHQ